jgi:tRNA-2-methylthio-N6-dimethylallyladenosine synthase
MVEASPKRVYIETYGCQMNEHDSERIVRLLAGVGYAETREPGEADLIFVNTCSVREKPQQKVYSALGRFKTLKEERGTIIGVTGCVAQQEGRRLLKRVSHLDLVIGTQALHRIPELVHRVEVSGERLCETCFDAEGRDLRTVLPRPSSLGIKSFVTIMQGCSRFCSYCIVPYVRGPERSRPSGEILDEVRRLADAGVKELCLLGQNVNAYGKTSPGEVDFPGLLSRIDAVRGIERIRFTTSHPADLSEELIGAFSSLGSLCEHIHLPFQSGSDRILMRMNRGYSKATYLEKTERLKKQCPSLAITADVIVGFPGEEEADFLETLDLMDRVGFDDLFSFKYSLRTGTAAARFEDQVEDDVRQERLARLQSIQRETTLRKNQALAGRVEEVLIEGANRKGDGEITGRTRSHKIVNVEGPPDLVGKTVRVRIVRGSPHALRGELVSG